METSHIVFIHGLSNKPIKKELQRIWLEALAEPYNGNSGFNLGAVGVQATFVYWADLFYDTPLPAGDYESNFESEADEVEASIGGHVDISTDEWSEKMSEKFGVVFDDEDAPVDSTVSPYERIPLPKPVKKLFMKKMVREAHSYLFNVNGIRDEIRSRVLQVLTNKEYDNVVIVGHSQGSFIAYDVLTMKECPEVQGFMTIGSPLGVDEIQDELEWGRENGFPKSLKGNWINVYDSYDPVSRLDPKLSNDFKKDGEEVVIDIREQNWGTWRHSATKYLKGSKLRQYLRILSKRP